MKGKLLILLVAVLWMLSFAPVCVTQLEAAEGEHIHQVSASCETEGGKTFKSMSEVITSTTITTAITLDTGSYYLNSNVSVRMGVGRFVIPEGAEVDICLNGYEIYGVNYSSTAVRRIFDVAEGATLNICDCQPTRAAGTSGIAGGVIGGATGRNPSIGYAIYNQGTVNMYGGSIAKNSSTSSTARSYGISNFGTFNLYGGNIVSNIGYNLGGAVYVGADSNFNMYGGSISGNSMYDYFNGYGAGVYVVGGTFHMYGGTISNNQCTKSGDSGAGVYIKDYFLNASTISQASFIMEGGTISGNKAPSGSGAGVFVSEGAEFIMKDGKITGNISQSGAGVSVMTSAVTYLPISTFVMEGGTISNNIVSESGGAVEMGRGSIAKISGGTISRNKAVSYGGAIYGKGSSITLSDDCLIKENTASKYGGAITMLAYSTDIGSLNIKGGTIQDNYSDASGGGIFIQGSTLNISGGNLTGNEAAQYGGGIYLQGSSDFFMSGGKITGNTADMVGGVYLAAPKNMYFSGTCTIKDNFAKEQQSNLYIPINTAKFISVGKAADGTPSSLSADSVIGVTVPSSSLKVNAVLSNTNDADYASSFVSDATGYGVVNSRINKLYLTSTYSITWENVGEDNWPSEITVPKEYLYGIGLTELPQPVREGYRFDGWYSEEELENEISNISENTTGDLTLWAKWSDIKGPDLDIMFADGKNSTSWYDSAALEVHYQDNEEMMELSVKMDDGDYVKLTNISSGDIYEITEEGEHTYTFRAEDASGNVTETDPITVKLDNTAPEFGTISYPDKKGETDNWIVGQTALHIVVPVIEEGSGASKVDYVLTSEDGVVQKASVDVVTGENEKQAEIVIAAEWKGTIQISCTDARGNRSEEKQIGIEGRGVIVEKRAPAICVKAGNTLIQGEQEFSSSPILSVTVKDGNGKNISSGIKNITYQIGSEAEVSVSGMTPFLEEKDFSIDLTGRSGKVTIKITAVDFAGNQTIKTVTLNISLPEEPTTTTNPTTPAVTSLGIPVPTVTASTTAKIKISWKAVKGATGYQVYRYNTKTQKYKQIKKTKSTTFTDTKLTPGTSYAYRVRAYASDGTKSVIGKVSKVVKGITRPYTPVILSVKKRNTTTADIKIRTVKNVKGYRLYEYVSTSKRFKLVGKIEGNVYYKYSSKTKKFTRDKSSKVAVTKKTSAIQLTVRTANVDFKTYRRYRFKVRSYVSYGGKTVYSEYSKVKIVNR